MAIHRGAVLVAHPDDETLWTGGFLLNHPDWSWFIGAICRGSDPDRAPKFFQAIDRFQAAGKLADLDDGVDQNPLPVEEIEQAIKGMLPGGPYDLVLTHGPWGEYSRHRRHEETSWAVRFLWITGQIDARALWMFAYQDRGRTILPEPVASAHRMEDLSEEIWQEKYRIVTQVYGFASTSWEARVTPRREAFWCFNSKDDLSGWENKEGAAE